MDVKKVADAISNLRKQKGLTQKQLAQQFGISDKSVSKWERAETMPDISLLPEIAAFFGISVDELLEGKASTAFDKNETAPIEEKKQITISDTKKLKRKYTIVCVIADLIMALVFIALIIAGIFTDNGWKDVIFTFCLIIWFCAICINQYKFFTKINECDGVEIQVFKRRCSVAMIIHCIAVAVLLVFFSGLFNDSDSLLGASAVSIAMIIACIMFILRKSKFVKSAVRYKAGALLYAVIAASICVTAQFSVLTINDPSAEIEITLLRALTDVAGLKGIIPFFVLIIGATAYTTVAVCKDLPSWSVIAAWTAVGACAVIVCTIAQDAFVEMYSEFTAGIISYHTASFLIYSGIVFCAGALILNVLSKKFATIPNTLSD